MKGLVAPDHINVGKRIFDMYNKPKEVDYNSIAVDLNTKLKDEVIKGDLYDAAFTQLETVIEKSEQFESFKRIGKRGEYTFKLVQK